MTSREWGVVHVSTPDELHRGPMTEAEAYQWVKEWDEDFKASPGGFRIVARHVGPWMLQAEDAAIKERAA